MGWPKDVWNWLTAPVPAEQRAVTPFNIFGNEDAGAKSHSGLPVTEETAFKFSVAYAAMTLIADGVSSLPPTAVVELPDGTTEAGTLPAWVRKPHPELRRYDVWNQMMLSMLAWGNGYAMLIRRPSDGVIVGLEPLSPSKVECEWHPEKRYARRYRLNGTGPWYGSAEIFHVQGPTLPGEPKGMSVIAQAREAIGLGLTLEEFGSKYFGQGSQAKIVLEMPQRVDDAEARRIVKTYERFHKGRDNWHRPAIVSGGAKVHNIQIHPNDAQFLESREFVALDVARWFRVPPHRVGMQMVTGWGSGMAEENLAMLQHTYRPWIIRFEGALTAYSAGGEDRGTLIKLKDAGLLRGTFESTSDVYGKLYAGDVVTKNEARQALGLPKVKDGEKFMSDVAKEQQESMAKQQQKLAEANQPDPYQQEAPQEPGKGRTEEEDKERKQDEAKRGGASPKAQAGGRSSGLSRHLPGKHNQKLHGRTVSGTAIGADSLTTAQQQKKLAEGNAKYGMSQGAAEAEIDRMLDSDPSLVDKGKKWYPGAKKESQDMAKRHGVSEEEAVGVISACSPRCQWGPNKAQAEEVLKNKSKFVKGGEWENLSDAEVAGKLRNFGAYPSSVTQAVSISRGADPEVALTGPKRRSFFNNISNPGQTQDVTIDGWMGAGVLKGASTKPGINPKKDAADYVRQSAQGMGMPEGAGAGYITISDAVRAVADRRGMAPDEVQAAYWIGVRGAAE